jgi:hypothetical protein
MELLVARDEAGRVTHPVFSIFSFQRCSCCDAVQRGAPALLAPVLLYVQLELV